MSFRVTPKNIYFKLIFFGHTSILSLCVYQCHTSILILCVYQCHTSILILFVYSVTPPYFFCVSISVTPPYFSSTSFLHVNFLMSGRLIPHFLATFNTFGSCSFIPSPNSSLNIHTFTCPLCRIPLNSSICHHFRLQICKTVYQTDFSNKSRQSPTVKIFRIDVIESCTKIKLECMQDLSGYS